MVDLARGLDGGPMEHVSTQEIAALPRLLVVLDGPAEEAEDPATVRLDVLHQHCARCGICFEDFQAGEIVTRLPNCHHCYFHAGNGECLGVVPWLTEHNECPVCRARVSSRPQAQGDRARLDYLQRLSHRDANRKPTIGMIELAFANLETGESGRVRA